MRGLVVIWGIFDDDFHIDNVLTLLVGDGDPIAFCHQSDDEKRTQHSSQIQTDWFLFVKIRQGLV